MIEIVPFQPEHSTAFRDLNYAWIEKLFKVEGPDKKLLENPQSEIIDQGGEVLIALLDGNPVGTCALIKMEDDHYELGKMAVDEKARGNKIGWKLGEATVKKARELGAKKITLETNSSLTPAITLYKKLGFTHIPSSCSEYERCDVRMELIL